MKLLILASTYPRWKNDYEPGFVHELAKRLTARFEVSVLCPHAPGALRREIIDGISVVRFRYAPDRLETLVNNGGIVNNLIRNPWLSLLLPFFFISMAVAIVRLKNDHRPDVIHAHWIIPQGFVLAVLKMLRVKLPPILLTAHGGDLFALDFPLFRWMKKVVISTAARFTVVSEAMREFAIGLGVSAEDVTVRSMGIDLKGRFKPDDKAEVDTPTLLFVGRFVSKKGADLILEALPTVIAQVPAVSAIFVGYGPEEASLKERAKELGLENIVSFNGPQDQNNVARLYRRASVLAAPFVRAKSGDADGFGLVVAEALASGCPVVTSDLPVTKDITSGMKGVVTFTAGDVNQLSDALCLVLKEPGEWRQRASGDRALLVERLDWSSVAKDYERYLSDLVFS